MGKRSTDRGKAAAERMLRLGACTIALGACLILAGEPVLALAASSQALPAETAAAENMLTAEHDALPGFAGHMPLVVLEPTGTAARQQDAYFWSCRLSAMEGTASNSLQDIPSFSQTAEVRTLTDSTNTSDRKHDYFLRLEQESRLLGLPANKDYFLLGAMGDKSLLRNYIGYTLAQGIFEDAPEIQLCEVFLRTDDGDRYQGVYLLVERITDPEAVVFHRSDQAGDIPVETYATRNDPEYGNLSIPLFESTQWEEGYVEPISQLSGAEEALYSTNSRTFYTYPSMFDVPSFVGGFILGELTENYAGMADTYYNYHTDTRMLSVAPLWSFEQALDNQPATPADPERIRYQESPYYYQFFKSPQFAQQIRTTYLNLRKSTLSESYLMRLVDEAAAYVLPAAARDWARWDAYSGVQLEEVTNETVQPASRQTDNYSQEILRIKYHLREHSLNFALEITQFDFQEREISKEIVLNSNPFLPLVFIVLFFAVVWFVNRHSA